MYSHRYLDTNRIVQNGYVVIVQDVRGRFKSEGDFFPFLHEAEDGYDTVEWAANSPFSMGKWGCLDCPIMALPSCWQQRNVHHICKRLPQP